MNMSKPHWSIQGKLTLLESECACAPGVFLANGRAPEYFTDYGRALKVVLDHGRQKSTYWSVHLNGKHVLGIVGED